MKLHKSTVRQHNTVTAWNNDIYTQSSNVHMVETLIHMTKYCENGHFTLQIKTCWKFYFVGLLYLLHMANFLQNLL